MKMKQGNKTMIRSMKEFEREYYPNSLSERNLNSINNDPNLGTKLAKKTIDKIKKKYFTF
jgi:hypothetical protein